MRASDLAAAKLMAKQLIDAVRLGQIPEALIPVCVGADWIEANCHRRKLSRRLVESLSTDGGGAIYRVRPLADIDSNKKETDHHG